MPKKKKAAYKRNPTANLFTDCAESSNNNY